ncbi:hypothetical protein AALA54_16875, partial [Oscillospiraceae bacterium 44-34]
RGVAAEAGVHIKRTEAHEDGPVQADRMVLTGSLLFTAYNSAWVAGLVFHRPLRYTHSIKISFGGRRAYAIFHAMCTVLALEGEDFKKHSAVISRFTLNDLKPEI